MTQREIDKNRKIVLIAVAAVTLSLSACASAKKAGVPIERTPEGKVPHPPQLKNAEVKVLWVPEKVEPDRWEEGHYLYLIEKPSTWEDK